MRAAYDGIYFDLRNSIIQGDYRYKDYLPSESVLVKRYGCAHNTVRKAISILAQEGMVLPVHGKGVRVLYRSTPLLASKQSRFEPNGIDSFIEAGKRRGFATRIKVIKLDTLEADDEFSQLTGFEVGTKIVAMERVRYYDGQPLVRETSYFRATTVEGITKDDAETSVYRFIEQVHGNKLVTSKRVITVEPADERDYELLDMGSADYVAAIVAAAYSNEGLLCEVSLMRHHPSSFSFSSTVLRTSVNSVR